MINLPKTSSLILILISLMLISITSPSIADEAADFRQQQQQAFKHFKAQRQAEYTQYKQEQQQDFKHFKAQRQAEYTQYKQDLQTAFKAYKQLYATEYARYRQQMSLRWGKHKTNQPYVWVNHDPAGKRRDSVNFKTGVVKLELLADKQQSLKALHKKAKQALNTVLNMSPKQAFSNDVLSQKIEQKLKQYSKVVKTAKLSDSTKVMVPLVKNIATATPTQIKQLATQLSADVKVKSRPMGDKKIVSFTYKIPKNLATKAQQYAPRITQIASTEKLPTPLIYAVIETESAFNTHAKSAVPAYGLMQIVPTSAGIDASQYLFGQGKVLAPSYLYNSDNNIAIGSAYLHILYYRYLKRIKDKTSRLYCTIAAYNTGAGNVAKSFIGTRHIGKAINKINTLSAEQVYQHLKQHLPYAQTKSYLQKVTQRMTKYSI